MFHNDVNRLKFPRLGLGLSDFGCVMGSRFEISAIGFGPIDWLRSSEATHLMSFFVYFTRGCLFAWFLTFFSVGVEEFKPRLRNDRFGINLGTWRKNLISAECSIEEPM